MTKIHYFVLKTLFFQTYKNVNKQLNLFQSVFSSKLTFWSFTTMCRSSYFSVMNDGMDCITKEGLKENDVTSKYRGNCPMAKHISFEIGGRFLMYFYASRDFFMCISIEVSIAIRLKLHIIIFKSELKLLALLHL